MNPGPGAQRPLGPRAVVGSHQPDQRAWAPSQGLPQVGGGQSPGPADWPAPRKAPGPQTWQQRQRRKAVSDRLRALSQGSTAGSAPRHAHQHKGTTHTTPPAQAPPTQGHTWGQLGHRPPGSHPPDQGRAPSCLASAPSCRPTRPPSACARQQQPRPRPGLDKTTLSPPARRAPGRVQASPCCRRLTGSPVVTPPPSQLRAEPAHRAQEPRRNGGGGPQHLSTRVHTARPPPAPQVSHSAGLSAAQGCACGRNGPRRRAAVAPSTL